MYAEVVVNRAIIKSSDIDLDTLPDESDAPPLDLTSTENPFAFTFHYEIPPALRKKLEIGQWVAVPFRSQTLTAIVVGFSKTSPFDETRPLIEILDNTPVVTPAQIELARWLSAEYLTPLATCLRYFMPSGSGRKPEYVLKPMAVASDNRAADTLDAPAQILLTYLRQKGMVRLAEINP